MDQRLAYVHNNPVGAGFVDEPRAWAWSSCRSYETGVEITCRCTIFNN